MFDANEEKACRRLIELTLEEDLGPGASPDADMAYSKLLSYGVQYVVVGELERAYFPTGVAKWAAERGRLWDIVYDNGGVQIYQLRPDDR